MTTYGILLVDTSWNNEDTAQIEKVAFLRYQNLLGADTRALIYMREPVNAVVAEAEITSDVIETEAELLDHGGLRANRDIPPMQPSSEQAESSPSREIAHEYYVPLKLVRPKGMQTPPILLTRLQQILGADFSVYDETWIPLSEDQYNEIIALWDA